MNWLQAEWKKFYTWAHFWLGVAVLAAPALYENVATLQQWIPVPVFRYGMSALGLLVIVNTLRKKGAETPPAGPPA